MKRKKLWVLSGTILIAVILAVMPIMAGCAEPAPPEVKTLKIGCLMNFEFPLGVDCVKELEALVPVFNEKGGLVIGGERYNIDLIIYDSKFDPPTARAAVERLIYQDKVKFILGDETTDSWLPITEENKVLVVANSPSPVLLSPDHKYVFQSSSLHTNPPSVFGWFVENYPDMKTFVALFTDDLKGHAEANMLRHLCDVFDRELLDIIHYPPDCTDFSAFATRLAKLNPDVYTTCAGGPVQDALSMKGMKEAGWEGQILLYVALSPEAIGKVISLEFVEGMIAVTVATELPSPSPIAKELKDAYIAKHGSWPTPVILHVNTWYCLIEALKQAQSLDVDEVAAVIANGLRFETPQAPAVMISRPDLGNPRTVDALYQAYMIRVEGGKAKLIDTISLDKALENVKKTF